MGNNSNSSPNPITLQGLYVDCFNAGIVFNESLCAVCPPKDDVAQDITIRRKPSYKSLDEAAMVAASTIFEESKDSTCEYGITIFKASSSEEFYLTNIRRCDFTTVSADATIRKRSDIYVAHVHSHPTYKSICLADNCEYRQKQICQHDSRNALWCPPHKSCSRTKWCPTPCAFKGRCSKHNSTSNHDCYREPCPLPCEKKETCPKYNQDRNESYRKLLPVYSNQVFSLSDYIECYRFQIPTIAGSNSLKGITGYLVARLKNNSVKCIKRRGNRGANCINIENLKDCEICAVPNNRDIRRNKCGRPIRNRCPNRRRPDICGTPNTVCEDRQIICEICGKSLKGVTRETPLIGPIIEMNIDCKECMMNQHCKNSCNRIIDIDCDNCRICNLRGEVETPGILMKFTPPPHEELLMQPSSWAENLFRDKLGAKTVSEHDKKLEKWRAAERAGCMFEEALRRQLFKNHVQVTPINKNITEKITWIPGRYIIYPWITHGEKQ
jgi:hypothetical protein